MVYRLLLLFAQLLIFAVFSVGAVIAKAHGTVGVAVYCAAGVVFVIHLVRWSSPARGATLKPGIGFVRLRDRP